MKRWRDNLGQLLDRLVHDAKDTSSSEEDHQPKRRRIQPLPWGQSASSESELDEEYVDTGVQIRMHDHNEFTKLEKIREELEQGPEESMDEKRYRLSNDFLNKLKSVRILTEYNGKEKTLTSNIFRSFIMGFLPLQDGSSGTHEEVANLNLIKNSLNGGSQLSVHLEKSDVFKPHVCFIRAGEDTKLYSTHLCFHDAKKVYHCKSHPNLQYYQEYYILYHLDIIAVPWYARFEALTRDQTGEDTSFLCQLKWHLPFSLLILFLSQYLTIDLRGNFYGILYNLLVQQVSYTHSKERHKHELEWSDRDNEKWDNMNHHRNVKLKTDDYRRQENEVEELHFQAHPFRPPF